MPSITTATPFLDSDCRFLSGAGLDEAAASLRAHPAFPHAMRSFAKGLLQHRARNRINWLLDDRGRVLFGYAALYLHFARLRDASQPGLTISAMKAICSELRICSTSRTVSILALMRFAGYLTPDRAAGGRSNRFVPTPALLADHRSRWRMNFGAFAGLLPEGEMALARLDNEDFAAALVLALGEHYRAGFRLIKWAPELEMFAARSNGMMLVAQLIGAHESAEPDGRIHFPAADFAKRAGLSRSHILSLLREADAAGLLQRHGDQGEHLTLMPAFIAAAEMFHAMLFLFFAHCAAVAIRTAGLTTVGAAGPRPQDDRASLPA